MEQDKEFMEAVHRLISLGTDKGICVGVVSLSNHETDEGTFDNWHFTGNVGDGSKTLEFLTDGVEFAQDRIPDSAEFVVMDDDGKVTIIPDQPTGPKH